MIDFYKAHLSVAGDVRAAQYHLSTIADYLELKGFDGLNLHFGDLTEFNDRFVQQFCARGSSAMMNSLSHHSTRFN